MIESMSEALIAFLAELDRQEAAGKTLESYRSDLLLFAGWVAGARGRPAVPAAITTDDIHAYQSYLIAVEQKSPATVNRRLAALRKFFGWANATGRVAEPPTANVRGLGRVPRTAQALDREALDRMVRIAEADQDKRNLAILQLLRATGIRVGELTDLRLGAARLSRRTGELAIGRAGSTRERIVPLNAAATEALAAYLAVRPHVADDHLFVGRRGAGLKPQAVENVVKKYARRAGLKGVTPSTFRRAFAREMLDGGTREAMVAAWLGHERLETTRSYLRSETE